MKFTIAEKQFAKFVIGVGMLIAMFVMAFAHSVHGQESNPTRAPVTTCPPTLVCYSQTQNNDIFQKLTELAAARDTIATMLKERGASDVAVAAAQRMIATANSIIEMDSQIIARHREIAEIYQSTLKLYADLVERLQKELNRPRSVWSKIVSAVKAVVFVLAGIAIGNAGGGGL